MPKRRRRASRGDLRLSPHQAERAGRGAIDKVTVLCSKADAKPVQQGLARGQAIAAGVAAGARVREPARQPLHADYLAEQAKKLGKEHG
jgi:leucyl aminopeptidase